MKRSICVLVLCLSLVYLSGANSVHKRADVEQLMSDCEEGDQDACDDLEMMLSQENGDGVGDVGDEDDTDDDDDTTPFDDDFKAIFAALVQLRDKIATSTMSKVLEKQNMILELLQDIADEVYGGEEEEILGNGEEEEEEEEEQEEEEEEEEEEATGTENNEAIVNEAEEGENELANEIGSLPNAGGAEEEEEEEAIARDLLDVLLKKRLLEKERELEGKAKRVLEDKRGGQYGRK